MKFGLEQHIIDNLIDVFEQYTKVDKAIVFGSRAKGNYRPDSDIDIAIKGQDLNTDDIIAMSVAFEEKGITHKIDLINYDKINDLSAKAQAEPDLKDHIDRVGIELYSRWKNVKLQDIVSKLGDGLHGTPEYDLNGEYYFINGNNLIGGKIVIKENTQRVTKEEFLKYKKELNDRTILLGINGTIGNVALYNGEKCILGKSACYFNVVSDVSKDYIKYVIMDKSFQAYIENFANGSTIMNVSLKVVREYEFTLPPINEQTAIANILSSLDDKIDLLHRQNKTLEQLAETLFRQWFVEEAEESWEEKSFKDLIETSLGGEWGKENPEGDFQLQVQCIRGTDIADLQTGIPLRTPIRFIKQNKFESIEIKDGDLVMEISGGTDNQSTGRTTYINDNVKALFKYPLVFSNFCRLIRPKKKEYSFFIYSYIHHLYEQGDLFNLENGSSGIKNLNYKALLFELAYKLPNEKKIIQFHKDVEQYFYKINKNKFQIRTLTQTRDTLLPKLMSGEVRVKI